MTAKLPKSEQAKSLKVKTGVKAGKHCWDAFNSLANDQTSRRKRDAFLNCCFSDPECLHQ
jgi:hypothetical protein